MEKNSKTALKGTEFINNSTNPKNQKVMRKNINDTLEALEAMKKMFDHPSPESIESLEEEGFENFREMHPDFEPPIFDWPCQEAEATAEKPEGKSADNVMSAEETLPADASQKD